MLATSLIDQTREWQEIFGGGPLAAFLGLVIIACLAGFVLFLRANRALLAEKDSHAETIRSTERMLGALEGAWTEQLKVAADAVEQRQRETNLQSQSLAVLERAVALVEQRRRQ